MQEITFTLDVLQKIFPKQPGNSARTGLIPIEFFNMFEADIRKHAMRPNGLRAIYRGPRKQAKYAVIHGERYRTHSPSMTRRQDAEFVLLYMAN